MSSLCTGKKQFCRKCGRTNNSHIFDFSLLLKIPNDPIFNLWGSKEPIRPIGISLEEWILQLLSSGTTRPNRNHVLTFSPVQFVLGYQSTNWTGNLEIRISRSVVNWNSNKPIEVVRWNSLYLATKQNLKFISKFYSFTFFEKIVT